MRQALRGAVDDVDGLGIGARRDAARRPVREARRREDPDPRRPGRPRGRLQRDQRRRGCAGEGYPNVPHGSSFVHGRRTWTARCPDAAHDPHLLAVDQPEVAWFADQTRMFSRKAVGRPCASASARSSPTATSRSPRFGKRALHEPAGDHLPAAAAPARAHPARAGDGQRQAGEGRGGPAGAACACRCAGAPKGRYRIRVKAKTTRKRTIRLDRGAPARARGRQVVRRAARRSPRAAWRSRRARRSRSTRPTRRATSPRPTSARRSTPRPSTRRCCAAGQRRQPRRGGARSQAADPERSFAGQTCAGAGARAARATCGSTTGWPKGYGQVKPVVFTAATARRSPGACG